MDPYARPMPTTPGNLGHSGQGLLACPAHIEAALLPRSRGGEATALFTQERQQQTGINHGH